MYPWVNSRSSPTPNVEAAGAATVTPPPAPLTILGVTLDDHPLPELLAEVRRWLHGRERRYLVTPNPEMLVAARSDPALRAALQQATRRVVDGVGLILASYCYGRPLRYRIAGTDLVGHLLRVAAEEGSRVFFLGGAPGVAAAAAAKFQRLIPNLKIIGATDGGRVTVEGGADHGLIAAIARHAPDLLVVGFGHGKQERFLANYLPQLPSVKVAVGAGGALDYWSERIARAPRWLRRVGLEWLYRVLRQPQRLPRILTATVVFPCLVIHDIITQHARRHHQVRP